MNRMSLNKIQLMVSVLLLIFISVCFIVYTTMSPQFIHVDQRELPQLTLFLLNIAWFSLVLPSSALIIGLFLVDKNPVYIWSLNQCTWLFVVSSILLIIIGSALPYIPMCANI